jgi:hypothetical protein
VVTVLETPVLSFVAVTEAFGTTALAASNTVPVKSPEVLCAKAAKLRAVNTIAAATNCVKNLQIRIPISWPVPLRADLAAPVLVNIPHPRLSARLVLISEYVIFVLP